MKRAARRRWQGFSPRVGGVETATHLREKHVQQWQRFRGYNLVTRRFPIRQRLCARSVVGFIVCFLLNRFVRSFVRPSPSIVRVLVDEEEVIGEG